MPSKRRHGRRAVGRAPRSPRRSNPRSAAGHDGAPGSASFTLGAIFEQRDYRRVANSAGHATLRLTMQPGKAMTVKEMGPAREPIRLFLPLGGLSE